MWLLFILPKKKMRECPLHHDPTFSSCTLVMYTKHALTGGYLFALACMVDDMVDDMVDRVLASPGSPKRLPKRNP